jgi:alpha/beta hydrolase fold
VTHPSNIQEQEMPHHPKSGMPGRLITGTIAAAVISAAGAISATAAASNTTNAAPATVAASLGFADHAVIVNGVRLHYVTVGKGEPVLLLPGWPQSWYAWRFVMKELAASGREVFALDPRGFGDSEKPASGYDLATASDDVHAFIQAAGLARPGGIDIVSHDVGTWIDRLCACECASRRRPSTGFKRSPDSLDHAAHGYAKRCTERQILALRLQSLE